MNKIEFGDCRDIMRRWKTEGVQAQTCVTSPPYYGLRDYGHDGQIGLEETPQQYVDAMVEVFQCVRDVLRDDGTLWLNLGDSYAGSGKGQTVDGCADPKQPKLDGMKLPVHRPSSQKTSTLGGGKDNQLRALRAHENINAELPAKNLIGIPWRVAFALQADGWYLRQDIIWHKPNPMPESVTDRCGKAHEYIFLFSKKKDYYFDHLAIKEPLAETSISRLSQDIEGQEGSKRVPGKTNGNMKAVCFGGKKYGEDDSELSRTKSGNAWENSNGLRNKRSVWTVPSAPYKEAHFACFPPDLIHPCIVAGAPMGGIVLDPFMGSGTTAYVAQENMRKYLGCELNPEYKILQDDRLKQMVMC